MTLLIIPPNSTVLPASVVITANGLGVGSYQPSSISVTAAAFDATAQALAAGWTPPVVPVTTTAQLGCYTTYEGAASIKKLQTELNFTFQYGMEFLDTSNLSTFTGSATNLVNWWKANSAWNMIWAIGGLVGSAPPGNPVYSFAQVASGAMDTQLKQVAATIAAVYPKSIIRIFHEFNGGWFAWAANGHATDMIAAWKHIVNIFRAASAGFTYMWNPTRGDMGVGDLMNYYPGDQWVDYIALDVYDVEWGHTPTEPSEYNNMLVEPYGLNWLSTQAKNHNKLIALGEWGLWKPATSGSEGGGDDPTWINLMSQWIKANNALGVVWDNGSCAIDGGNYPNSLAALATNF